MPAESRNETKYRVGDAVAELGREDQQATLEVAP